MLYDSYDIDISMHKCTLQAGLDGVKTLAFEALKNDITTANILAEVFSPFTTK